VAYPRHAVVIVQAVVIYIFWVMLVLGGTLECLIEQDGALPETCVKLFGQDLVEGEYFCAEAILSPASYLQTEV